MSITKAQTTKWSARVKVEAQEMSIAAQVADTSYQVESVGAKTIKIIGVATPTINDYVPGAGLTYEALTDNETDLNIDQMHDFAFAVNDVEEAQSTPDYAPVALMKAAKALALKADAYVFGSNTYANANIPAGNKFGTLAAPIAITISNVEEYLDNLAVALRENHVSEGITCVVNPKFMSLIRRAKLGTVTDNSADWDNRTVSKYAGMTIVESTEVVKDPTADGYQILAFSNRAIPMAATLQKMESLKNPDDFGDLTRGLFVFGSTVLYPEEVAVLSATL